MSIQPHTSPRIKVILYFGGWDQMIMPVEFHPRKSRGFQWLLIYGYCIWWEMTIRGVHELTTDWFRPSILRNLHLHQVFNSRFWRCYGSTATPHNLVQSWWSFNIRAPGMFLVDWIIFHIHPAWLTWFSHDRPFLCSVRGEVAPTYSKWETLYHSPSPIHNCGSFIGLG